MNIKKSFLSGLFILMLLSLRAQYQTIPHDKSTDFYVNPIFAGDYPDPSILRDGDDYYVVHSSFEYYPGLLIWQSKDLINWSTVTNALYKYVGSVWAPELVKYEDKYYIYFPASGTNYVVFADKINGPWSDPVELKVEMIDPCHAVDEKGNRYLYFSSGSYVPLSKDGLSVTGEAIHSYQGWKIPRDWSIECYCLEGPKLIKHGDYYYLTVAEGGTAGPATGHMVISARSKSILGPWENSLYNPIIRAISNNEKWWSKGHGTVFEDIKGDWWILFHGYEKDFYNRGRQSLLLPIEWTNDGWYKIPEGIKDSEPIKKPDLPPSPSNYILSDNFEGNELKPYWKFFGEYDTSRFRLEKNSVIIDAKGDYIGNCSPLLCNPPDHSYMAEVELSIEGKAIGGLVLFYNQRAFSGILADNENILANINGWQFITEKKAIKNHVFLRMKNINNIVDLYYSLNGEEWIKIENSLETSGFHHNAFGGFMSIRIGLCSIGDGSIIFKNFKYNPIK